MLNCWVDKVFLGATVASMVHPCLPVPDLVQFLSMILWDEHVPWVNWDKGSGQEKEEKNKACAWGHFGFVLCGVGWVSEGVNIEELTLLCCEVTWWIISCTLCINWMGGTVEDWVGFDDGGFSNCHWLCTKVRMVH